MCGILLRARLASLSRSHADWRGRTHRLRTTCPRDNMCHFSVDQLAWAAMQAPVVPSGPHLAYWDSKDEALVNARGMQVCCSPSHAHRLRPSMRPAFVCSAVYIDCLDQPGAATTDSEGHKQLTAQQDKFPEQLCISRMKQQQVFKVTLSKVHKSVLTTAYPKPIQFEGCQHCRCTTTGALWMSTKRCRQSASTSSLAAWPPTTEPPPER